MLYLDICGGEANDALQFFLDILGFCWREFENESEYIKHTLI